MIKRNRRVIAFGVMLISVIFIVGLYLILMFTGTINSGIKTIKISTSSLTKEYDGTALVCNEYEITKGKLRDGHYIDCKYLNELKDVGTISNEVAITIYDSNNIDVTKQYDLEITPGNLNVTKRNLQITTLSADKMFDGQKLTYEEYEAVGLLEGHEINIIFSKSITNIGTVQNACSVTVCDSYKKDVTGNYDISYDFGTLEVKSKTVEVTSVSKRKVYDGTTFDVNYDEDFKLKDSLISTSHNIEFVCNPTICDVGSVDYFFTCKVYDSNNNDVTYMYNFVYNYGKLTITPSVIEVLTSSKSFEYNKEVYSFEDYNITNNVNIPQGYTIETSNWTTINEVGWVYNVCDFKLYDENHIESNNYQFNAQYGKLTVTKRVLYLSSSSSTKTYDGTNIEATELKYEGLLEDDILTYEALETGCNVGTYKPNYSISIYDSNGADVLGNYNLNKDGILNLIIKPKDIKLTSKSNIKEYDGQDIELNDLIYDESLLVNDDYLVYEKLPTFSDVGKDYPSYNYIIYDIYGQDNSSNYNFIESFGILEIAKKTFPIDLKGYSTFYDGNEHYPTLNITQQTDNFAIFVNVNNSSITNVGKLKIEIDSILVYDMNTGLKFEDDSKYFEFKYSNEYIEINKCKITLKSGSASKPYDGTALTYEDYFVSSGSLVKGEELKVNFTGSQTEVGESYNEFTVIEDSISSNYEINYEYGALEVTITELEIIIYDKSKTYDGTPFYKQDDIISNNDEKNFEYIGDLKDNEYILLTYIGLVESNVGKYEIKALANIYDENNYDVTQSYSITIKYGTYTIKPINVTIVTCTKREAYSDGYILKCEEISMISGNIIEGHSFKGVYTSLDYIGTIDNDASFVVEDNDGNDMTSNYNIIVIPGKLTLYEVYNAGHTITITPEVLYSKEDSQLYASKLVSNYNGSIYNGDKDILGITEFLSKGFTYTATVSLVDNSLDDNKAGIYKTIITDFKLYHGNSDVTSNYVINYKESYVSIYKYEITICTNSLNVDEYNGTLSNTEVFSYGLKEGHEIKHQSSTYLTKTLSRIDNKVEYTIIDSNTLEDVTYLYKISEQWGSLYIANKKSITIDLNGIIDPYSEEAVYVYYDDIDSEDLKSQLCENDILDESYFVISYNPVDGIYSSAHKIYKEINNEIIDVSELYEIEFIYPEE